MIRFYAPDINETFTLPESDSGHCCRVLRMTEGDEIEVVNGKGISYHCRITDAHPKRTKVEVLSESLEQKHWIGNLTLAVAPTKNMDRMEWLIEKSVEIGIDRIIFLKCERSERKEVKDDRILKILVSAMKQSMKATLPVYDGMVDFKRFISEDFGKARKFIGYCSPEYPRLQLLEQYEPLKDAVIVIGPEGDFAPQEIKNAVNNGFECVTFGNTRLRTETAALYSLTNIHSINEYTRIHKSK